jgi:CHAT domain-containing protein/uncharacterized protein HemY
MPPLVRIFLLALCLGFLPSLLLGQPVDTNVRPLSWHQVQRDELHRTDRHRYELRLEPGQFLQVTVACRNVVPILNLLNGTGKNLLEVQFFQAPSNGKLSYHVAQAGLYQLTITSEDDLREAVGRYELTATVTTRPSAEDLAFARALLLQQQYWPLLSQGTAASLQELLKVTQESLPIWQAQGERAYTANALTFMAEAYKAQEQFDPALEHFKQALAILREIGVPARIAGSLIPIGQIYAARSDYRQALEYYLEALVIFEQDKHVNMAGWNLTNIGQVYTAYGEPGQALEYYRRSYAAYDQYQGAATERFTGLGVALSGMANTYLALGEKQQALDHLKQALDHFKNARNRLNEYLAYARMGEIFTSLGDYQQAELYLNQAVQHFRHSQSLAEANALSSLGQYAKAKGDQPQALAALQTALAIRRKLGNRRGQAQALTQIGAVNVLQGQVQNALLHFAEAQTLWQEIGDKYSEGITLNYLGLAYFERQEMTQARTHFQQALTLRRATNDREGEANTLYNLARVDLLEGQFQTAQQQIEAALRLVESVRATVHNEDLRASYLATVKDYYEFYVDLLMQRQRQEPDAGFASAAWRASEMARARSLSETLAATQRQLRQGIPPQLLQREEALQQRLNAKAEYQRKLIGNKARADLLLAAAQEIQTITAELQEARTAIQVGHPQHAALLQAAPLTVKEMQQSLLDEQTLLLSYALGKERSYLWVISPTSISSHELPPRHVIEAAARQVYEQLIAPTEPPDTTALEPSLQKLSELILAPVCRQLGQKRLLIVADGALQYIPFAVLPEVTNAPLIVQHEIIHLPSATSLAVLRREMKGRTPAARTVAVFADPVFTADDPRLLRARHNRKQTSASSELEQALRDIGESSLNLRRLPLTRREAEMISTLVQAADRKTALDFTASRANARQENLRDYRILHFATHGILNSTHPELSGLVLSLVDEHGQAQDGFLRLHEIYNLRLQAELVVLSACQTGLGKDIKGEGLIGLTRGFMYAGAPRVIASLWKVSDKATAEFMQNFYQGMLGEQKLSPAAALRAAQIKVLQQKRWEHPRYWAAFTLQGEWQ